MGVFKYDMSKYWNSFPLKIKRKMNKKQMARRLTIVSVQVEIVHVHVLLL